MFFREWGIRNIKFVIEKFIRFKDFEWAIFPRAEFFIRGDKFGWFLNPYPIIRFKSIRRTTTCIIMLFI